MKCKGIHLDFNIELDIWSFIELIIAKKATPTLEVKVSFT